MKYRRFEDLPVWRAGQALAVQRLELLEDRRFGGRADFRDQLGRAAISITNNIAEGFELGTTQQLIKHLYYARGSAGEVRSMLRQLVELSYLQDLESQISGFIARSENVSRQLAAWADSLQNTDIKGQQHLTESERAEYDRRRRADAFWQRLTRIREEAAAKASDEEERDLPVQDRRPEA